MTTISTTDAATLAEWLTSHNLSGTNYTRTETEDDVHACCHCDDACDCESTDGVCLMCSACHAADLSR